MEIVNLLLQSPLLQILAAICGCLIGSLAMNPVERYGIRIAILFTMLSMLVASALSEYLAVTKEMEFVTVHAAIGGGIGLTGQFLIEEIKQSAPKFFKSLLNILTSTLIDSIVETIVMFFDGIKRRIKKWLPK